MGSDGGRFDASDRLTADRLNRKTVLVDTGANIAAVVTTPGMLAFCTSSGLGFSAGQMYQRNEEDTAWYTIVNGSSGQTLGSKTINVDENTIKDSATNNAGDVLVNNGTKFVRKARGAARTVYRMNAAGTDGEFVALSGGSLATGVRRPLTQIGSSGSGNAGAATTSYSSAIGQVSRAAQASGNLFVILIEGKIKNNAAVAATPRLFTVGLHIDNSEVQTETYQLVGDYNSSPAIETMRRFTMFYFYTSPDLSNHTFDVRIKNSTGSSDSDGALQDIVIRIVEFGGTD